MNRGIDPATHRPLNEAAQDVTTISFSGAKEEKEKINNPSGFVNKDEKRIPVQERCPDLNLDLRISPPYHQNQPEPLKTGGRTLCLFCSLGVKNSKDCTCSIGTAGSSSSSSNSNNGYDFLVLKTGFLDYRSLEMK